ncbi:hypothetical protein [Catellatospora citrea]|uniref:hypothetical protein n=1 Tax=Catellatospora citrea TaxID=53366 RepID=UPI000E706EEC|nr:hypothetical protein [Catellatospora citrea]
MRIQRGADPGAGKAYPGVGFGPASVRGLGEAADGTLVAEVSSGGGLTVMLPQAQARAAAPAIVAGEGAGAA